MTSEKIEMASTNGVEMNPLAREQLELHDRAFTLSSKLDALLLNAYGQGGESFRNLSDQHQDYYIWTCHEMAAELRACISRMLPRT